MLHHQTSLQHEIVSTSSLMSSGLELRFYRTVERLIFATNDGFSETARAGECRLIGYEIIVCPQYVAATRILPLLTRFCCRW